MTESVANIGVVGTGRDGLEPRPQPRQPRGQHRGDLQPQPRQDRAPRRARTPRRGSFRPRRTRSSPRRCRSRAPRSSWSRRARARMPSSTRSWTCSSRATSSSTAATRCSPTPSAARRRCARPASTSSAPGISGGEEGALLGPSIMPGGSDESWVTLGPILKSHRRDRRGRAVRHARRPRRRRPLREDGAQRHRVRRHAAHRRGLRPDPPRHRQDPRRDRRRLRRVEHAASSSPT